MSTAVIITGQPRTFAHCLATQQQAVFRKLDDPHFFVSFANVSGKEKHETEFVLEQLRRLHCGRVSVEWVDQPAFPEELRERYEAMSIHAPYFRSVPVEAIWKMFWHLARGWDFFKEQSTADDEGGTLLGETSFDRFIRIRPDSHFHAFTPPRWQHEGVFTPWWGSWGGIPDRFAYIVGEPAAAQYFNVFHKIGELLAEGCAYHPETMLGRAMERAGIRVSETMDAEFTTIRAKGDKRPHDAPVYTPRDWARFTARSAEARD